MKNGEAQVVAKNVSEKVKEVILNWAPARDLTIGNVNELEEFVQNEVYNGLDKHIDR